MKIVVTGGTGFLGRHVVWRFANAGHDVIFTGRNTIEANHVMKSATGRVRFVQLDHGSNGMEQSLLTCSTGADAIVHCAALASPWGSYQAFKSSNIDATRQVVDACKTNQIGKLVHISSPSVYFQFADRLRIREDDRLPIGVNEYARSKQVGEQIVLAATMPHSVILRPRAIFGPWDNALLPRLVRMIRFGRVPLLRGGRALLDLTYVDNMVDAIDLALALPANPVGSLPVFNISNGEPIEVKDLFARIAVEFDLALNPVPRNYAVADFIARALEIGALLAPGWEPPFTRYSLGAISFSQTLDLTRAREFLGYKPRITLAQGITRTAEWWRQKKSGE